jgi:hypothetical protein
MVFVVVTLAYTPLSETTAYATVLRHCQGRKLVILNKYLKPDNVYKRITNNPGFASNIFKVTSHDERAF